jgi:phosphatidate cytidylyltransferase
MKTFFIRAASGLTFAGVVLGCIIWNEYTFSGLFFIINALAINEYYTISAKFYKKDAPFMPFYKYMSILIGITMFEMTYFIAINASPPKYLIFIPLFFLIYFVMELFLDTKRPFRNIGLNLLCLIYIVIPFCTLNYLAFDNDNYIGEILVGIILIIWMNDVGAYIFGSLFGKHKLYPSVSPNKSVEGAIGGAFTALLMGFLTYAVLGKIPCLSNINRIDLIGWEVIAIITFTFATMGDLIESKMKRSLGIKDTGTIMPGHGGILDRFDAFIFAIPFITVFVMIFYRN